MAIEMERVLAPVMAEAAVPETGGGRANSGDGLALQVLCVRLDWLAAYDQWEAVPAKMQECECCWDWKL